MPKKKPQTALQKARAAQKMSLVDAAFALRELLADPVSVETIRRYETGATPESGWDPDVIAALSIVYKTTISNLSAYHGDRHERRRELVLSASRWMPVRAA